MAKQTRIKKVPAHIVPERTTQHPTPMQQSRLDSLAEKVEADRRAAEQRAAGLAKPGVAEIP